MEQTQEVVKEAKVLTEALNNPEVAERLLAWASFFKDVFRGNSFTIEKIAKKTQFKDPEQTYGMMHMLILKGLAHQTEDEKGNTTYKITLTPEERIKLLREDLIVVCNKKIAIEKEIEKLSA